MIIIPLDSSCNYKYLLFITETEACDSKTDWPWTSRGCHKIPWETDWNGEGSIQGKVSARSGCPWKIPKGKASSHGKIQTNEAEAKWDGCQNTVSYSKLSPYDRHRSNLTQSDEHKRMNTFLSISLNICFGCIKEPSHPDFWVPTTYVLFDE